MNACAFLPAITIGFQPSTEVVSESDGSVELCARLLRGDQQLERDVVISFMTNDGSASGKCVSVCVCVWGGGGGLGCMGVHV